MILTKASIIRELEKRGMWLSCTTQFELTPNGTRNTYLAHIMQMRTEVATARGDTEIEASRRAFAKLVAKE